MFSRNSVKLSSKAATPLLVSAGISVEIATNHHPDAHARRAERMEEIRRMTFDMKNGIRIRPVKVGSGGNIPEPPPIEETLREIAARRRHDGPTIA